jgi:hypothetical protein
MGSDNEVRRRHSKPHTPNPSRPRGNAEVTGSTTGASTLNLYSDRRCQCADLHRRSSDGHNSRGKGMAFTVLIPLDLLLVDPTFLSEIISVEQSAFVPNRIFSDNIIAAYECLQYIRTNGTKQNGYCALKLDMSKAYDRVEWSYLAAIMERLGFRKKWVDLIINV